MPPAELPTAHPGLRHPGVTRTGVRRRRLRTAAWVAGLALAAGCAGGGGQASESAVSVENCGATVTFEQPPERLVLLKSASVTYLAELGVLDRVVARAGAYPQDYYDDSTWAALEQIPMLTDQLDTSGHLQISREEVLAQRPDLVLGEVDNLDRSTLQSSGVPLLEEPALCPGGVRDPSFDDITEQLTMYGQVFGEPEAAEQAADALRDRLSEISSRVPAERTKTAAVLYPTVGGGVTYAYGARSMAAPQLEAAGLQNVFGEVDERVFEVTREELIGRNPDVLVLLHSEGDPAAVEQAVASLSGAGQITAIRDGLIVTQLLNFTEPPTPLAVEGLDRIVTQVYGAAGEDGGDSAGSETAGAASAGASP